MSEFKEYNAMETYDVRIGQHDASLQLRTGELESGTDWQPVEELGQHIILTVRYDSPESAKQKLEKLFAGTGIPVQMTEYTDDSAAMIMIDADDVNRALARGVRIYLDPNNHNDLVVEKA